MANPQYGQRVASAFENVVTTKPIDQLFKEFWIFQYFTKKNGGMLTLDGGRNIEVTLDFKLNPNFTSSSESETLPTSGVDTVDAATFEWRAHTGTIRWDEMELFQCSGESAKYDYLANKIENAINSHKDDISDALVGDGTGNSSKDINGLQNLVKDDPSSGSPGGINRATYSWWRNQAVSGAQTSTAFDNLRARMRSTYNDCSKGFNGNHPKVIASGLDAFQGYESLLVANERITSKTTGDAGFRNGTLTFKGADIGYDEKISDARMYFLNPDGIKLVVGKGHYMKQSKEIESINQLSYVKKFHTFLQLVLKEPRLLGVIHSIS